MRLLIGTPVFPPLVGGMETMAVNLATHFTARGIDVHVVTRTPSDAADDYPFKVSRGLSKRGLQRAVRDCDIVLSNGAGLYVAPHAVAGRKPLVFRHTNYQVTSVEGAGFIYGKPSPLHPFKSILFHLRHHKSLRRVLRDGPKMLLTRFFAKHLVSANVAISDWMAMRQPLPRQVRIYNPFPISRFEHLRHHEPAMHAYTAVFLGRLTAEKGVDTLLQSVAILRASHPEFKLLIIGDGAFREVLEAFVKTLGVSDMVAFAGALSGERLLDAIASARIAVVPSLWEEPFGGVTTELLASGKPMVVSERGALAEIVGKAGLTFPNGNAEALAETLHRVIEDPALRLELQEANPSEVTRFDESRLIDQYIMLFQMVLDADPITQASLTSLSKPSLA